MSLSSFSSSSPESSSLAGLARCVRRICLLREQDNAAEADRVEKNEFANTLRDLRLAYGPDILPENELRALFATEEKRVADAAVLSELLVPQLVKSFQPVVTPSVVPQVRPASAPPTGHDTATPFPRAAAAAGVSPIIADLLDAMLASERTSRQPVSSNKA